MRKYVHEAYPAWLRAHPGEECSHRLIEFNEYMEDKDSNDAWSRPLKMFCGAARWAGAKRLPTKPIAVTSVLGGLDLEYGRAT